MQFYTKFLCQTRVCDNVCPMPGSGQTWLLPLSISSWGPRAGPGPAGAESWSLALRLGLSTLLVRAPGAPRLWFLAVETSVWALQVPFHGELTLARGAFPHEPHQDHSMCPALGLHNLPWLSSTPWSLQMELLMTS